MRIRSSSLVPPSRVHNLYLRAAGSLIFYLAFLPQGSDASMLLYEGFNGYSGNLSTVTPNANTIGLNQSTAYAGSSPSNFTINASSLSFGSSFLTSGGSVTTPTASSVAAGKLAIGATPFTGTLYGSYLVQFSSKGGGAGDGALIRISDTAAGANDRFVTQADSRVSSSNVALGYDATATNSSTGLSTGTTYLMISRFTNVGTNIPIGGGVGTVYALTLQQYNSFVLAGGTDAYLDGATIGSGNSDVTARGTDSNSAAGTFDFATGRFVHFVSVNDGSTFDEVRFGSTLADVTPVPEPATCAFLGLGLAVFCLRRRDSGAIN